MAGIPVIEAGSLFGADSPQRRQADAGLMRAAADVGFFVVQGLPHELSVGARARAELLRVFELPEGVTRLLWRQKFAAAHANVYRGWFPLQKGFLTSKEGIDIGPDVLYGAAVIRGDDPLCEASPLPAERDLPGWRQAVAQYYRGMLHISRALMRCVARGLQLAENFFDAAFEHGISTLRLLRYPLRDDAERAAEIDPGLWVDWHGARRCLTGAAHVDSGFLTLLAQDGVPGLQARHRGGEWLDVPPAEDALAVNFGKVLERWSGARIRATEHRVVGTGRERFSIPFFYEARVDAEIRPLPLDAHGAFEPFLYGDHLWAATTQFVEFKGLEHLRRPQRW